MRVMEEAVETLARTLANEALFDADIGGYGWDSEKDSSDHFMPTARRRAGEYLAALTAEGFVLVKEEGKK